MVDILSFYPAQESDGSERLAGASNSPRLYRPQLTKLKTDSELRSWTAEVVVQTLSL